VINKQNYRPQENTVLGSSFKVTLLKKIILNTDFAISKLEEDSATINKWAGQSSLQFLLKGYTTTLGYRRVQPGFKSLGTPYMLNDIELLNWMNNFSLAQGRLNITAILSSQHNNLDNKLASELQTFVSNLNINALLNKQFNLNVNYNGYNLHQKDGTSKLSDSSKLNQQIHQLSVTPSYTLMNEIRSNTISANVSYMLLNDKNPATTKTTNSNNLSGSLNYTLGFIKQSTNVTISGLYSQYKQDTNYYKTYGATLGSSAQLLKDKSLSVQGSVGYLINRSSFGNAQNNLTFSGNVGYRVKHHSLSAYANYIYTPYNPINNVIINKVTQAVASKNLAGGIAYNYSF
jgi:hypothetical protein